MGQLQGVETAWRGAFSFALTVNLLEGKRKR